jgi:hypothetical protein
VGASLMENIGYHVAIWPTPRRLPEDGHGTGGPQAPSAIRADGGLHPSGGRKEAADRLGGTRPYAKRPGARRPNRGRTSQQTNQEIVEIVFGGSAPALVSALPSHRVTTCLDCRLKKASWPKARHSTQRSRSKWQPTPLLGNHRTSGSCRNPCNTGQVAGGGMVHVLVSSSAGVDFKHPRAD